MIISNDPAWVRGGQHPVGVIDHLSFCAARLALRSIALAIVIMMGTSRRRCVRTSLLIDVIS